MPRPTLLVTILDQLIEELQRTASDNDAARNDWPTGMWQFLGGRSDGLRMSARLVEKYRELAIAEKEESPTKQRSKKSA